MDKEMKDLDVLFDSNGFTVTGITGEVAIVQVGDLYGYGPKVVYVCFSAIPAGTPFTISYDKSAATTKLTGTSGDEVESFTISVTNNKTIDS